MTNETRGKNTHVLLFGATGRVGQFLLADALAADYRVTAVVRNPARLQRTHPNLTVVAGDVNQPETLLAPLQSGVGAVINVIGGDVFKPSTVVTDSARAIVPGMRRADVLRYLGITGTAQMPATALGRLTVALIRRSPIRHAVRDHDGAFQIVSASPLDWTLAGCPYIRDSANRDPGKYQAIPGLFPGGFKTISPQAVADFLLRELAAHHYPRQIVGLWN